jgi:hypothetical protein
VDTSNLIFIALQRARGPGENHNVQKLTEDGMRVCTLWGVSRELIKDRRKGRIETIKKQRKTEEENGARRLETRTEGMSGKKNTEEN